MLTLAQIERKVVEVALRRCGGNVTHAAKSLGVSKRTIQRKQKAWTQADKLARRKTGPNSL